MTSFPAEKRHFFFICCRNCVATKVLNGIIYMIIYIPHTFYMILFPFWKKLNLYRHALEGSPQRGQTLITFRECLQNQFHFPVVVGSCTVRAELMPIYSTQPYIKPNLNTNPEPNMRPKLNAHASWDHVKSAFKFPEPAEIGNRCQFWRHYPTYNRGSSTCGASSLELSLWSYNFIDFCMLSTFTISTLSFFQSSTTLYCGGTSHVFNSVSCLVYCCDVLLISLGWFQRTV